MLLVGVGGSGGKTLQLLHRELRWRLRDYGWTEGVPEGWQFVHIDVPTDPDTGLPNDAVTVNTAKVGGRYVGLAPTAVSYRAIDDNWLGDAQSAELPKVVGWRPRAQDVGVAINAGAGQYRTIGRVIALSRAEQIRDGISQARTRLSDPGIQPQMQRLTKHLGAEGSLTDLDPQVIVVSSMAGGSGAGMFLDVADIIRAAAPAGWCDSSIGILYTADVFEEIPPLSRQGVMPNSLAAICELMNGYWNNSEPGFEYRSFERAGIPVAGFQRRGLRYPLFVGRSNNSVTFPSQNDVYAACSKTLAAFMTSPSAQGSINAYLAGNFIQSATAIQDNTPFKDAAKGTLASAMGMGSLSLGRDRFARYTSQRLARAAVEHALRAHLVGRKVPEEITFEAARDQAAMMQKERFVEQCGLDEMGEEHNQVLDELRPRESAPAEFVQQQIKQQLDQFQNLQPNEAAQIIINVAEQTRGQYIAATDELIRQRAYVWVEDVVAKIEATTLDMIARTGLEVTVTVLHSLINHVADVINDLNTEIAKFESNANKLSEGVFGAVQEWGTANMTRDNELLAKAGRRAVRAFEFGLEGRLRRTAGELLNDLKVNEITPLYDAARNALSELQVDEHPPPGTPNIGIENWPVQDSIPTELFPALNERLVEAVDTFPASFDRELVSTVRRSEDPAGILPAEEAQRLAVGEILTGRGNGMTNNSVIVSKDRWWPNFLSSQRAATPARYELLLSGEDLLNRAEDWTARRDSALGDYVHQSLRSYVESGDPAEQALRKSRVLGAFREVLGVSPPLIQFNNMLVQAIHGTTPTPQYHFTSIPFAQTDLEPELVAIAENSGQPEEAISQLKAAMTMGDDQRIEIITTLSAPVQPLALQSVMRPIAEQWVAARDNPAQREQFWRWRRARALPEFIPTSPEVLRSMIKGWFLGRIVGAISWDKTAISEKPILIFDKEYQRDTEFPFPYLGPAPASEQELLPVVLESMGIAMLDCQISGVLQPLKAYKLLRELGENSGPTLTHWIRFGQTPSGTQAMKRAWAPARSELSSEADATPQDRQAAVTEYLEGRHRNYVGVLDKDPVTKATMLTQPRWLDLRDQLDTAFTDLISEAARVPTAEDTDGGD